MTTTHETRRDTFAKRLPGKVRRSDRRATIARKYAYLTDALTVRVH